MLFIYAKWMRPIQKSSHTLSSIIRPASASGPTRAETTLKRLLDMIAELNHFHLSPFLKVPVVIVLNTAVF
jgi:hypothetical protein